MSGLVVVLGIPLAFMVGAALSYNRFISQKTLIRSSWANVDTELQRRYDLIPNLVASVKGYAAHERQLFESVASARATALAATGPVPAQAAAEGLLVEALRKLLAVSEAYPKLQADSVFLDLQRELANTEDRLQAARRFYNLNVQAYNRRVQSVPSSLIAGMFKFTVGEYFEVDPVVRSAAPPSVA